MTTNFRNETDRSVALTQKYTNTSRNARKTLTPTTQRSTKYVFTRKTNETWAIASIKNYYVNMSFKYQIMWIILLKFAIKMIEHCFRMCKLMIRTSFLQTCRKNKRKQDMTRKHMFWWKIPFKNGWPIKERRIFRPFSPFCQALRYVFLDRRLQLLTIFSLHFESCTMRRRYKKVWNRRW